MRFGSIKIFFYMMVELKCRLSCVHLRIKSVIIYLYFEMYSIIDKYIQADEI